MKIIVSYKSYLFSLLKKAKHLCLSIDLQMYLFLKVVIPVLLYGCEVCGYENNHILEKKYNLNI